MAGYAIYLDGDLYHWAAYRHATTPIASAGGEYLAAIRAAISAIATSAITRWMGYEPDAGPPIMLCDNIAAVKVSDNDFSSKRMQHIATKVAFLQEEVKAKRITLIHISSAGQVADMFTKPLAANAFHPLRTLLVTSN